ncbi:MAG: rod shape-determining protein MreD [Anaerolineaceae bacterium 4572_5.1]|nr:MAG: rod shape-determining protein MreD [Anaerolineaceae bacterium 4572_5.1]RLD07883.1 MAG: rod shape-determining protein MreD [Chloroflexota bacterium]
MGIFLAIPILSIATILQSAVISRITLLQGTADIVLLIVIAWALQKNVKTGWQWGLIGGLLVDFISGLPFGIYTIGYLLVTGLTLALQARIWRLAVLVQLFATFVGTILIHALSILVLVIRGTSLPLQDVLQTIVLPSLILNLFLAIPVYSIIRELAGLVYPEEIEI